MLLFFILYCILGSRLAGMLVPPIISYLSFGCYQTDAKKQKLSYDEFVSQERELSVSILNNTSKINAFKILSHNADKNEKGIFVLGILEISFFVTGCCLIWFFRNNFTSWLILCSQDIPICLAGLLLGLFILAGMIDNLTYLLPDTLLVVIILCFLLMDQSVDIYGMYAGLFLLCTSRFLKLGFGDVKYLACISLLWGLPFVLCVLILSLIPLTIQTLRKGKLRDFAYGPYLAFGFIGAFFLQLSDFFNDHLFMLDL